MKRILTALLIAPIRLYQRFISPALAPRCRYYPSCSEYAVEAIRELGPIRGLILAGWRLLRCNPFSHGGFDEVSERRLFRNTPTRSDRARNGSPTTAASERPNLT
ncbi:MAG TPA: membrane protein insertion efficiency factor YidD [Solirubrobacterales bacterium]